MSSMPGENMPSVKRGHLRQLLEKLVPAAGQAHLEQASASSLSPLSLCLGIPGEGLSLPIQPSG